MMCMHILEKMNSIVYRVQRYCIGSGLRWGDCFWGNIAIAKSQSSISMLILSNRGIFLFSRKIVIRSYHFL